ncbi:hypothetical protein O3M35_009570 [Rhynocoris fuscipes]|uniref:Uncharacterized protein n=1 Tax=Rhynocoris fuscipes TaxID=488301 RepID=A0AAW1D6C3_9HEMI
MLKKRNKKLFLINKIYSNSNSFWGHNSGTNENTTLLLHIGGKLSTILFNAIKKKKFLP